MTAPAVVRRWTGSPVRVGGVAPGAATLADQLVRMRRLAPMGAVLLTGLVLHAGVVPHLAVWGVAPDVLLVAVVAVALTCGSRAGAGFGFAAGLGADVFLASPLGTSALAYTLLGHVVGGSSGPRPARSAAALCRPGATCFSCRTGRHRAAAHNADPTSPDAAARPSRARRRIAARRAALRRLTILTALGVGAGRLTVAVVATSLGGAAFPGMPAVSRMAAVAALSAPLGPPAIAALQRLSGRPVSGGLETGRQGDAP